MKIMIKNWKSILLILFAIIISIESYYIFYLRECCHRQVLVFHKFFERQQKDFVEYKNPFATISFVMGYLHQGDLKKSLAWANLIIDTLPDNSDGLYNGSWLLYMCNLRGDVYYKMGDYVKAIDDYSAVLDIDAQNIGFLSLSSKNTLTPKYNIYIKRAMAFRNLGEDKNAIKDFCYGIILAKNSHRTIFSKFDDYGLSFVAPLPDDLLNYLEKNRDTIDDEVTLRRCVQILEEINCAPVEPVQAISSVPKTPDSGAISGEKPEPNDIDINVSSDNSARKD